jgi:hypothetical protein
MKFYANGPRSGFLVSLNPLLNVSENFFFILQLNNNVATPVLPFTVILVLRVTVILQFRGNEALSKKIPSVKGNYPLYSLW